MKIELNIGTILDEVVHQFSDTMAFFRELVQNSIDAGSGAIEIEITNTDGQTIIDVRDWGEGMTRRIIESKLVRLFSSGKDDDLTKIGRFGIGFASVFAIDPDAVVVTTGRDGEYWRLLFSEDRRYELFALDQPVEGTQVQLYKTMDGAAALAFENRARQVIEKWCKYAEIPIFFQGEEIGEFFAISSYLKTTYSEEGTRIVMGFVEPDDDFAGYYHRGLTLQERDHSPFPWVAFRIDSRYLEHTLTRDQILEDDNFSRANDLLRELATEKLPQLLIDRLEELAEAEETSNEESREYATCLTYLAHYISHNQPLPRRWQRRNIFVDVQGNTLSLRDIEKLHQKKRLLFTREAGLLGELILSRDKNLRILLVSTELRRFLSTQLREPLFLLEDRYISLSDVRLASDDRGDALKSAAMTLLEEAEYSVADIFVLHQSLPPSLQAIERMQEVLLVDSTNTLIDLDGLRPASPGEVREKDIIIVQTKSPTIQNLMTLAGTEPEWAALALTRLLFGAQGRTSPEEDALMRSTVATRRYRLQTEPNGELR